MPDKISGVDPAYGQYSTSTSNINIKNEENPSVFDEINSDKNNEESKELPESFNLDSIAKYEPMKMDSTAQKVYDNYMSGQGKIDILALNGVQIASIFDNLPDDPSELPGGDLDLKWSDDSTVPKAITKMVGAFKNGDITKEQLDNFVNKMQILDKDAMSAKFYRSDFYNYYKDQMLNNWSDTKMVK